ncbi:MAG: hypothetical protein JWM16_2839 [Verrucomicrobiales bacterium]|nr:hypothetical protein [Verrucomicrobiales bacterium]
MDRKNKEVHYKKAVIQNGKGNLQSYLEAALNEFPMPGFRVEWLGADSSEGRVMLDERHHSGMLCVTMTSHTRGALQAVMGIAEKANTWPIRQVKPPTLAGTEKTEFLDGYLFFGVWKNHVLVQPSRGCSIEALEEHLNHFLRLSAKWPVNAHVTIEDSAPQEYRNKGFTQVQAFKLDVPVQTRPVTTRIDKVRSDTVKFRPTGAAWEGLKAIIKQLGGKLPEDSLIDGSFGAEDVHIKVEVTRRKKALDTAGSFMDVLGNSLRHVTSDVVKIKFEDGTELKGSDLKTKKAVRIDCLGKHLPVLQRESAEAGESASPLL